MKRELKLDRRILKAFYTQYVAVLLIVLVVSVSAVSKAARQSGENPINYQAGADQSQIGSMDMREMFLDDTSAQLRDGCGLEAVFELLRNHDVRATVTVYARSQPEMLQSYRLALLRARAIHSAVLAAMVPAHAVQLRVASAVELPVHAVVSFESMGVSDERS